MAELRFLIEAAEVARSAAVPTLNFKLRVENAPPVQRVHSILLRCQVQIEPARRRYTAEEQERLYELFDRADRWGQTLQPLQWTQAVAVVPAFVGATTVDLPIACSFDFNVAATKYFHGVQSGEIPAAFLFSGTVFYEAAAGGLQAVQIPWDREASFRVPLELWKEMMELYYPQSVWLSLRDDVFERLRDYKVRNGLPTYEAALESMLGTAAEGVGR